MTTNNAEGAGVMAGGALAAALADLDLDVANTIDTLGWLDQDGPEALGEVVSATIDLGRQVRRLIAIMRQQEAGGA
ncbi:hypothetical protein [Mycobacterium phage Weirdo19]|uniref:Uncharacterized protein n=1 Tax=Mycobacterium phage Weirdo19 TaxID=2601610 RepID=A0A6M2YSQ9_9CAUD|nr:hypothetical protein KDJ11_gp37 [Mycobacterium phage Weirdo19]QEA10805.1 hypothetical protein [Mycobacterium phage Weirdo19]